MNGLSYREIARILGIGLNTVLRHLKTQTIAESSKSLM